MYFIMYLLYIINKLHKYKIIKTILLYNYYIYIHEIIKLINTFFEIYQLV